MLAIDVLASTECEAVCQVSWFVLCSRVHKNLEEKNKEIRLYYFFFKGNYNNNTLVLSYFTCGVSVSCCCSKTGPVLLLSLVVYKKSNVYRLQSRQLLHPG